MGKDPFIWNAHEYYFQAKTADWYWAVGIIGVSVAVISTIYGNTLFALLVLISTFALSIFASKEPAYVRFEINKSGIIIGKVLFPFGMLESFWVEDNKHLGHPSQLFIKSKKTMVPLIAIPLEGMNPEDIRDFLLDHLLETPHGEPLGQKILEYFGF